MLASEDIVCPTHQGYATIAPYLVLKEDSMTTEAKAYTEEQMEGIEALAERFEKQHLYSQVFLDRAELALCEKGCDCAVCVAWERIVRAVLREVLKGEIFDVIAWSKTDEVEARELAGKAANLVCEIHGRSDDWVDVEDAIADGDLFRPLQVARDYGYGMRDYMIQYSEATTGDDEVVAGDFDWDGFVNSR